VNNNPPRIPDAFLNEIQGLIHTASEYQLIIGDKFNEGWDEMGDAYTQHFSSGRKAHRWFVESVASSSGIDPSTLRHYSRVSHHVTQDMRDENGGYLYSHWKAMLMGDGEPEDNLQENLGWCNEKFDEYGHPPPTRDIENHVRGNENEPTWRKRVDRMMDIGADVISDEKAPGRVRDITGVFVEAMNEEVSNG